MSRYLGYFLADAFVHLDTLLEKKLLRPDVSRGQSRVDRASEEAVAAKRCVGSLRYLWRNSPSKAHRPSVQEMKSFLVESPLQRARSRGSLENDDCAVEDAPPPLADQGAEDQGGEGAAEDAMSNGPMSDDNENLDESQNDSEEVSEGESMRAPTARLGHEPMRRTWDPFAGESPLPDSDGELPDSQRPGAWIGRFYRDRRTMGDNPEDAHPVPIESDGPDGGDGPDGDSDDDGDGQPSELEAENLCHLRLGEDAMPHLHDWIDEIVCKLGLSG